MQTETENNYGKLVGGERLLEMLFDESSRPSLRWLRDQQKNRTIPFVKLGHLVFFDPEKVRAYFAAKRTLESRERASR